MDENLVRDFLYRSRFGVHQAEALARIFAQQASEWNERFATKSDLQNLELRMEARFSSMDEKLSAMEARMTWRIIGFVGLFGAVITLADHLL